jgi:hypothetical protein
MMTRPQQSLKCEYHQWDDAIGVCTHCGRSICSACYTRVMNRTYCKHCFDEFFSGEYKQSRKLSIGGVLGIISGISAMSLIGPFLFHYILRALGYGGLWATNGLSETNSFWYGSIIKAAWIPLGLFAVLLSKYALERYNFGMALTGGILATVAMPPLGIPALILIVISRKEFKTTEGVPYSGTIH